MIFNNCAAWSKGWYKQRKNVSAWWMDLAHCINNDSYSIYSKRDVIDWIMHRFDQEPDFFKQDYNCFGYYDMYHSINKYKMYYNDTNTQIDDEDAIILYFRCVLASKSFVHFDDGGYKPSNDVLPLRLGTSWQDREGRWYPGEMMSDALKRINDSFPLLKEQKVSEYCTFNRIEAALINKRWDDVVTPLGSECGCTKYIIKGHYLNKIDGLDYNGEWFDMGNYSHSFGFEMEKDYKIYVKNKKTIFGIIGKIVTKIEY